MQRATSDFDWIDGYYLRCGLSPHAGQYRAEKYWSITTIMQPVPAFSSVVRARRLRLKEPVGALNGYLIERLRRATAPLLVAAIARDYLTEQGLVANKPAAAKWTHLLRERLRVLEKHGIAATVRLSGRNHQGWVLAERIAELSPVAQPLESPHQDNDVIFAELNRASRALTLTDLCRAVLRANGEQPTSARLQKVRGRLQPCLRRHRDRGGAFCRQDSGQHRLRLVVIRTRSRAWSTGH